MLASSRVGKSVYECLFEFLPQAALLLDGQLKVRVANQAASALFGIEPSGLIGSPITSLVACKDLVRFILDFGPEMVKVIEVQSPEEESVAPRILKITILRLPGKRPETSACLSKRLGDVSRMLLVEDVTEMARMEDQLVETEKFVAMGQLAAGIAHELANPLSSMSFNLQHIWEELHGEGDPGLIEAVDVTLEHLDQMRHLLRSLVDFNGQHQPRYEMVDLHDLVRRELSFISREAEKQGVEISASLGPPLPACNLDVRTIRRALLNLLKNALEAMPRGGRLQIRTGSAQVASCGGDTVVVEIEDSGDGIEEAELRKVFRPLYSTKPGGRGLGLPFCRQAIEEHGGEIHLDSRKGRGTTVTLMLPLRQPEEGAWARDQ